MTKKMKHTPNFKATKKAKMSSSSITVHVNEAVLIKPSQPTPNHILKLSALDSQPFVRFTVEYLLVYKPHKDLKRDETTANLKSALGHALVPYYPLAGRVKKRADGAGLEVTCRGQGAVFIDADSDSNVSEFEAAPKCVAYWRKFLALHVADVLIGAPPLVMQLTWLSDGGATLAVGFNHCLCDGIGSGCFLNSFAELASGKCVVGELQQPSPVWSRHLLDVASLGMGGGGELMSYPDHPEFKNVPDICGFIVRYAQERLIPTSLKFNKFQINELKKVMKCTCTSFEVISAHVWRSWVKALDLPCNQIVKLLFSVNIRKRVNPSIPNGYYGNAFVLGCAQANVRELVSKGLNYAIQLVRKAKERVGEDYVREVVETVSTSRASVDSVGVLILTQWSRLGLESVDFGLGKPVQVGAVCCDKYCMLLPVYGQNDAIKVNLAVPASAVGQYLHHMRSKCAC